MVDVGGITLAQALARARAAGIDRLDAQLLLLHALGVPPQEAHHQRAWLLAHDERQVTDAELGRFEMACSQRRSGRPLSYLTGHKEFRGLPLKVDPRVLIPRPDTEILVEWALEWLAHKPGALRALDLGTGSGAIALALKQARPDLHVEAIDRSPEALDLANENASRLGLDVRFARGDWLTDVAGSFDLIVSNPPYVRIGDPHLRDLTHEPSGALLGGEDGLDPIRAIIRQAPGCLVDGGMLILEHGWDQAEAVRAMLQTSRFADVATRPDLGGNDRCTGGIFRAFAGSAGDPVE